MWWTVGYSANPQEEIRNAAYPGIRLFQVNYAVADAVAEDCKGRWIECSPDTVAQFSAVAYYFGRQLHKELGHPIGLITSSVGATPAESWTSLPVLKSKPRF